MTNPGRFPGLSCPRESLCKADPWERSPRLSRAGLRREGGGGPLGAASQLTPGHARGAQQRALRHGQIPTHGLPATPPAKRQRSPCPPRTLRSSPAWHGTVSGPLERPLAILTHASEQLGSGRWPEGDLLTAEGGVLRVLSWQTNCQAAWTCPRVYTVTLGPGAHNLC